MTCSTQSIPASEATGRLGGGSLLGRFSGIVRALLWMVLVLSALDRAAGMREPTGMASGPAAMQAPGETAWSRTISPGTQANAIADGKYGADSGSAGLLGKIPSSQGPTGAPAPIHLDAVAPGGTAAATRDTVPAQGFESRSPASADPAPAGVGINHDGEVAAVQPPRAPASNREHSSGDGAVEAQRPSNLARKSANESAQTGVPMHPGSGADQPGDGMHPRPLSQEEVDALMGVTPPDAANIPR